MPTVDRDPLKAADAKKHLKTVLADGEIVFCDPHMAQRMSEREITRLDVINVLRAGVVREPEWESGEWRYQVWTSKFTVVVGFPEEMLLAVVTCWRNT